METPAAYNEQKERVQKLVSFVDNQKRWSAGTFDGHALRMMVSQGTILTEMGADLDPSLKAFTAVVGDQSAGKTVIVMSLLKQVILDVKRDIGTTVRTFVKQSCDLKQKADYVCSINYKPPFSRVGMTPNQLYKSYLELSEHNKNHVSGKIDTEHVCQILLCTNEPSLGCQVMDHAGFAPNVMEKVQESFDLTLQEYFIGDPAKGQKPCKNASVLLCHRLDKAASEGFFPRSHKLYNQVGQGQLFVALTQCDKLGGADTKESIGRDMLEEKYCKFDATTVQLKPSQILDFLEKRILELQYEDLSDRQKYRALPGHARLFFVSSYKGSIETLLTEDCPKKRFEKFLNDEVAGEEASERLFKQALYDKEGWRRADVMLLEDDDDEKEQVYARIGMKNLRRALQKKSAEAYKDAAASLIVKYKKDLAAVAEQLQAEGGTSYRPDVVNTMKLVLRKYIETYMVLTQHDLFNPETSTISAPQQTDADVNRQMMIILDSKREEHKKEFGWTLREEHDIFNSLERKGHFPPEDTRFCEENWRIKFKELLPYCVQAEDFRKERNLTSLIRRFQQEFALRSCLVKAPPVDPEQLQKDHHTSVSQLTGDLKDALMSRISGVYSKIYRGEGGANTFVAMRVALACLLHGQVVLDIMKDVDHFAAIFGKRGAAGAVKTDYSLVTCLKSASRVQNTLHPGRPQMARRRQDSRHQLSKKGCLKDMIAHAKAHDYPQCNPLEDLCSIIVAQFFDYQFERMEQTLDGLTRKITLCSPAYTPLSLHLGSLFLHQDQDFLQQYKDKNPMDHYSAKFINPLTESPLHIDGAVQPQQYDDPNSIPFSELTEDASAQVISINACRKLSCENRARLLSSMIKADKLPDTITAFESADQAGKFDKASLDFVCQRHITCSVKRTLDDVLEASTGILYDQMHPVQMNVQHREALNRFESLCLGFQYPHTCKDRPPMYRFRNEAEVIQFMYNNKDEILERCKPSSEGAQSPATDDRRISCLDEKIQHSPLFKKVVELASSKEPKGRAEADALVERLYIAWAKTQNGGHGDGDGYEADSRKEVTDIITHALLPERYRDFSAKDDKQKWVDYLQLKYVKIFDLLEALESFRAFVGEHGDTLGGGVDAMPKDLPRGWATPDKDSLLVEEKYGSADVPPSCWEKVDRRDISGPGEEMHPDDVLLDLVV